MRYIIWTLLLLLGNFWHLHAQFYTLEGTIVSREGFVLNGAHLHMSEKTTATDPLGNYSFRKLDRKTYRLVISHLGYQTIDTLVSVQDDLKIDFTLNPEVQKLNSITISRDRSIKNTIQYQTLDQPMIQRYGHASLGDLLGEISGVTTLKTGSTIVKPVIHGLHSSRVLIFNQNVRQEDHQWGLDHAPNIDVNTIAKASVIKGAAALRFGGDAIGGVIVLTPTYVPQLDTIFGSSHLSMFSNGRGFSTGTQINKGYASGWFWQMQSSVKRAGDRESPSYMLSNTASHENNIGTTIGRQTERQGFHIHYNLYDATIGILRASHIGNITDLVNAINNGIPQFVDDFSYAIGAPRQESKHHLAKASFYRNLRENGKLSMLYAFQYNNRLEFDIRRGINSNRAAVNLKLATHTLNLDYETNKNTPLEHIFGVSGMYQNNFSDTQSTGVRALIPNYDRYDFGVYTSSSYKWGKKTSVEAGIRYDYSKISATKYFLKSRWEALDYDTDFSHFITGDFGTQWRTNPIFDYHNIASHLGIKHEWGKTWTLLSHYSYNNRNPNPAELFSDGLHHATGQIELGNLRLRQESSYKIATTIQHKGARIQFDITPYIHWIDHFMQLIPVGSETTIRGAFPVWAYTQMNARLIGLDAQATWHYAKNGFWQSNIAYVNGQDLSNKVALIDMPPLNVTNSWNYTFIKWQELQVQLKSEIVFRQDRYPDNDFETMIPQNGALVPVVVTVSQPPPSYHLMHMQLEMPLSPKLIGLKNGQLSLGLQVQNIMNTNYRDYLNRMRFYANDLGRNFLIHLNLNF